MNGYLFILCLLNCRTFIDLVLFISLLFRCVFIQRREFINFVFILFEFPGFQLYKLVPLKQFFSFFLFFWQMYVAVVIIIIMIVIIKALKGTIQDFVQSPHCAAYCLQQVRSSGRGATVSISCATHRVLITCKMQCATWYDVCLFVCWLLNVPSTG